MIEDISSKAAIALIENGCFSINGFMSLEEASTACKEIRLIYNKYDILKTQEHEEIIVANHTKARELQGKLGDYSKPVMVTRGLNGFDRNMTEIFNVHKIVAFPTERIENFVTNVIKSAGHSGAKFEYSAYINKKVEDIRGFHRDVNIEGNKILYKAFVYLTDVPDYTYGPHSYIPGSHRLDICKVFANQLVGNYTDPNEYDFDLMPVVFTGQKGTMIMTTQAGMHRGLPQLQEKERIILVCKIRPY